jgi:predicted nucleic acid-binding protein
VITVSNTTPIISLSAIGKIKILRDIFEEIIIPKAVYDEIKSKHDGYEYNEIDLAFIKVETVKNTELVSHFLNLLDAGEAETIVLSKELGADNTIIDENIGYGVAKETGIVTEVKPLIDEMVIKGRWYSNRVYRSFLSRANAS